MSDMIQNKILSDESLAEASGGAGASGVLSVLNQTGAPSQGPRIVKAFCDKCGAVQPFTVSSGGRGVCTVCGTYKLL